MDTKTYWESQPTDNPYLLNGFNGTWNFSDHSLISSELMNFIMESFHPQEKLKRIPLEDINKLMNDVWEGPGSMVKIERMFRESVAARVALRKGVAEGKEEPVKTIDDYSDEEKTSVRLENE